MFVVELARIDEIAWHRHRVSAATSIATPQRGQARTGIAVEHDPGSVTPDADDAGGACFCYAQKKTVVVRMTLALEDERAGRGVLEALRGPGAPVGIVACEQDGRELTIAYDDAVTAAAVVRHLVEIELASRPDRASGPIEDPIRIAAQGLGDPQLDERRILERYVKR